MKIGDEVFVHGYIDEIRNDTIIIHNKGGYFGTVKDEVITGELPKKGTWIESNPLDIEACRLIECSECGFSYIVGFNVPYEDWVKNRHYCARCGAKLEGLEGEEQDENHINRNEHRG